MGFQPVMTPAGLGELVRSGLTRRPTLIGWHIGRDVVLVLAAREVVTPRERAAWVTQEHVSAIRSGTS